jgi:hypothetical protein
MGGRRCRAIDAVDARARNLTRFAASLYRPLAASAGVPASLITHSVFAWGGNVESGRGESPGRRLPPERRMRSRMRPRRPPQFREKPCDTARAFQFDGGQHGRRNDART